MHKQILKKQISPIEAYRLFFNFKTKKINFTASTIISYATHLFGGVSSITRLLIAKNNVSNEEKLHKIFNGAIDLIYPYLVNKVPRLLSSDQSNLVPVFVTKDKYIATLHCNINTKIIFAEQSEGLNYQPELTEINFLEDKMSWTKNELEEIRNLFYEDAKERINNVVTKPKTSIQWIPLAKTLEEEVWEMF
ncbi:MAG TPA: hypothetical protein VFF27_04010 [Bacteroidia bacterium]|nr:hypothetical protein [Bacteroidia bacterium]